MQKTAQEFIVIDPAHNQPFPLEVLEHETEVPFDLQVEEAPEALEISIVIDDIPGAPRGTPDPDLTVEEEVEEDTSEDENDAKSKKNEKWDWASKGAPGFLAWVKERIDNVPKHSGNDTAGIERVISYLDKLDSEISKAMRLDLEGELNADKVEEVRAQIDHGISMCQDRLDKLKQSKKKGKKKKAEVEAALVKEGQKINGVAGGVYITVPLLISRIARVIVNGTISAGKDTEDLYHRQVDKYKLTVREQAEVRQLLEDMGMPLRQDRGYFPDDDIDTASSDNFDWQANYKG